MHKYVIMGVQGSGKGTQALRMCGAYGLEHISVGDIFRWNMANHTKLAARITRIMNQGLLVPDDIVEDLALVGETYPLGEDGGEPDSWAAECSSPPLRRGDSGLCVARLQTLLVGTFGAAIVIDGQFGLATEDSVIAFQTSWGLVADGQAGPATWVALADAAS